MKEIKQEDLDTLLFIAQRYINAFETATSTGQRCDANSVRFYNQAKELLTRLQ